MIGAPADDPLWPQFKPLWSDLRKAGGSLMVAGGYGLFLKQHWLRAQPEIATIVPMAQWPDSSPRVTKDVDIVVGVDLIASASSQSLMAKAMKDHDFEAREESDRLWKFRKNIGADRELIVEFHSYPPSPGTPHIDVDAYRVKHKPSLGEAGIHGRRNPEAIGGNLYPYTFELDGVVVAVTNPVTWSIMKLVAMDDRWRKADEAGREEDFRTFHRAQAIKHARDVCRAVALTTAEERDKSGAIVESVRQTAKYQSVAGVCAGYFAENGRATQAVRPMWAETDLKIVCQILMGWFQPSTQK